MTNNAGIPYHWRCGICLCNQSYILLHHKTKHISQVHFASQRHYRNLLELHTHVGEMQMVAVVWDTDLPFYLSFNRQSEYKLFYKLICWLAGSVRLRLHWSQKRHNTTVWTDSRQESRNRVATFNPTCVSRLLDTQGLLVLCLL